MRKLLTSFVIFGVFVSATPGFAGAATLQENLSLIQTLTNQIKTLQEQIKALQGQQVQLQASTDAAVLEIIQGLKEGSEGDQVTLLQTLLAADAALYPEGKITGFYGPATRRAIERFQRKNGLEAVGFVGPRTRSELNKWIKEQFKTIKNLEDDVDDDVHEAIEDALSSITFPSDPCLVPSMPFTSPIHIKDGKTKIVQTGNVFIYQDGKHKIIITPNSYHEQNGKKKLLITPGVRYEQNGKTKIMVPCNGSSTTTPPVSGDTTAPILSSVNASATHQSAVISWITNEAASSKLFYGTTSPLQTANALNVSSAIYQTGHSLSLTNLAPTTTYYYVVESKDKKGNTATSSERSFTTTATPDGTAPSITAISVTNVGTSTATITWTTNENAGSKVFYGTGTPLNLGSASTKSDATLKMSHSLTLTGLTPNTTHYFRAESTDASNNTTTASETSFTTTTLPVDATAPVISAIVTTPGSTTALITWTTNEAANSKVYYGTTTPLSLGSAFTMTSGGFVTSHLLNLSSLTASTTYYMVVESKDAANNTATSSEVSFVTN